MTWAAGKTNSSCAGSLASNRRRFFLRRFLGMWRRCVIGRGIFGGGEHLLADDAARDEIGKGLRGLGLLFPGPVEHRKSERPRFEQRELIALHLLNLGIARERMSTLGPFENDQ